MIALDLIRRVALITGAAARGLWEGWRKKPPSEPDPELPAGWTYQNNRQVQRDIESATTKYRVKPPARKERK